MPEQRFTRRYLPRADFYTPREPVHPPYVRSILSEEVLMQTTVAPGGRDNIQWITLRPEDNLENAGMPGAESNYSKYRPPALILNHKIRWEDTYAGVHWYYTPSQDERLYRFKALVEYTSQLEGLQQVPDPSQEEVQRMDALKILIGQLSLDGPGFLESNPNTLLTNRAGIAWTLGAANVPVTVQSVFTTHKNRGQSFRLKRGAKPEGQVRFNFTIEIGNGNSLYALVIGDDGISSEFIHYRNMNAQLRQQKIDLLNTILDRGRLTIKDEIDIQSWKLELEKLQYEAKKNGDHKMTEEQHRQATALRTQIEDLQNSKRGLSQADQELVNEIEKDLYLSRDKFSLQENARTAIMKSVTFSFIFLRSGYVVIQSDDGRKIYENKRLTGGVPEGSEPVYGDGLPAKAYIVIKSDGGVWTLSYGHPLHDNNGRILTPEFELPFEPDLNTVNWVMEADAGNPGCHIRSELKVVRPKKKKGKVTIPAKYQIQIDMYSNWNTTREMAGRYTPELYYIEMHIPAGNVPGPDNYIWRSEDAANKWPAPIDKNRIMDLQIQDDRKRSRLATVTIGHGRDKSNLPNLLAGAVCELRVFDQLTQTEKYITRYGFTGSYDGGDKRNIEGKTEGAVRKLIVEGAHGDVVTVEVSGPENFLDKEIKHSITGNNQYVGDYLRRLARDAGMPVFLYNSLPIGNAGGCPRIKKIKPGTFPDVKPAVGTPYWQWMQEVVKKHAPYWDLWLDSSGLRLTKRADRLRPDLAFSKDVDITSSLALRRRSDGGGGLNFVQDIRDYFTSATFIGAMNPLTGMRYSGEASIPQATDERFRNSIYYTGVHRHYVGQVDDTLKSDAACRAAAREHLGITPTTPQGVSPCQVTWKVDYDESIRAGDIPTVNGIKVRIDEVDYASLNSGNPEGQQVVLVGKIAEDMIVHGIS